MTTQELAGRRLIRAVKEGATWVFYALDAQADGIATRASTASTAQAGTLTPMTFEALAGRVLGERNRTTLWPSAVAGIRKRFDFVSADQRIVGDAKYSTLVAGERLPPARFATIAEHVWLLEKTHATTQFLVFGNDREVPLRWLERYGPLAGSVQFFGEGDGGDAQILSADTDALLPQCRELIKGRLGEIEHLPRGEVA